LNRGGRHTENLEGGALKKRKIASMHWGTVGRGGHSGPQRPQNAQLNGDL